MKTIFPKKVQRQLQETDKLIKEFQSMITEYENFKYNNPDTPEQEYLRLNIEEGMDSIYCEIT